MPRRQPKTPDIGSGVSSVIMTYIYIYIYIYILGVYVYIYIYMCVCVCVFVYTKPFTSYISILFKLNVF